MTLPPRPDNQPPAGPAGPRVISSSALFKGAREVLIDHRGDVYRLRITRHDKLILQK